MRTKCCYRLIHKGEVIHTEYDSETRTVIGMPDDVYDFYYSKLPDMTPHFYIKNYEDLYTMCEIMLLADSSAFCVIETNGYTYNVFTFDGHVYSKKVMTEEPTSDYMHMQPTIGGYKAVGFRRTKLNQLRSCDGVYFLTAKDGYAYTNDGILKIDVELGEVNKKYLGYKDMINNGSYAVVYSPDGSPIFLERQGDRLIERRT